MTNNSDPFIVYRELFRFTKLVDAKNQFHQNILVSAALLMAKQANLDLVCFHNPPKGSQEFPLYKIVDFGKWKYSNEKLKKKQMKENRKEVKEIRFSMNIAENDVSHKIRQAKEFFADDDDVIFSMKLRGREKIHFKDAVAKMNEIVQMCSNEAHEISRKSNPGLIIVRLTKNKGVKNEPPTQVSNGISSNIGNQLNLLNLPNLPNQLQPKS